MVRRREDEEELINNTPRRHRCRKGAGNPWLQPIYNWYLPFVSLAYTLFVTFVMIFWLDGRSFAVSGTDSADGPKGFTQPEISTLISGCLVLSRTIGTTWQALMTWRCVFILLEKTGLSLQETSMMASWRLPPAYWSFRSRHKFAIAVVLLLAWPAQFVNPLASGSVSWIPSKSIYKHNLGNHTSFATPIASYQYEWFLRFSNVRQNLVKKSAGLASLSTLSHSLNQSSIVSPARRMSLELSQYVNGTAISNATVPFFQIEDFEWVSDLDGLPQGIMKAIKDRTSGFLSISKDPRTEYESPLAQTVIGTSALLKDSVWEPPEPSTTLPHPRKFRGIKYAAIITSRTPNDGRDLNFNCREAKSEFDPLPPPHTMRLLNHPEWNNHSTCYAVAKLHVTAGVVQCSQKFQSRPSLGSGYSTCLLDSSVLTADGSHLEIQDDPLVDEVMAFMPEVQAMGAALALYSNARLQGNLEAYLRNSLIQAYQGTWSALVEFFGEGSDKLVSEYWTPQLVLRAEVEKWRMWGWMGVNLLLVVAGVALIVVQNMCDGKTVNNPVVAALMVDSWDVAKRDVRGLLCNAVDLGKGHGDGTVRVRLEVSNEGDKHYQHPKLVVD
ncbi:putative uracil permease [Podospora fimiseda]|uniref:Uracil permease n=1 Tax=Podospora fimiseda TaxID=252190 RepID=A0AAN7H418_9PEZI|nr:putative uracil permease [Podospora fimiseda]